MRIPLPERFTVKQTLACGMTLLVVQLMEGTDLLFALLTFLYVVIMAASYNAAGGIFYPSGAWVLFTGTETALIGLSYKAVLMQPGQSNLQEPVTTMVVSCVGLAGMGVAGWTSRVLRPKKGLLADFAVGTQLKASAIGCLVLGVGLSYLTSNSAHESATLSSALAQLNHFTQLAILLGTVYEIEKSGGKRSTNWVVWIAGAYIFGYGLLTFSKEGMFVPVVSWLIPAAVLRFNFSKTQIALGAIGVLFVAFYLVPYAQAGRISRDEGGDLYKNYDAALGYLTNLDATRALYMESGDVVNIGNIPHLYDGPEGLFDRIQMLAFDDALITITDHGSVYGLGPAYGTFANSIPRFLWKNKPEYKSGNEYGRQIGVISEDDESTGISFSPTADAYHEAKWFGVVVVETGIMFVLFIVCDSLSGDVRRSPWGLLFIALFVHAAPEGELPGPIWLATFGAEGVIFAALVSGYAMPFLSRMLKLGGMGALKPV